MKAIAHVSQKTFNRFWNSNRRFVGLNGPDASGRDIEIQSNGDTRRIKGIVIEYENGVNTIEIFTKIS